MMMTIKGKELGGISGSRADASSQQAVSTEGFDPGRALGSMKVLLAMVEHDIKRSGDTESFMVRAGLLRDILTIAIAAAEKESA